MRNLPRLSGYGQHIHPVPHVYAGQHVDVLGVLELLAPTVYGERWRPLARVAALWVMTVIVIVLVRVPLPGGMPSLPDLLGALGF